jgi:hypothetical protein
MARLRCRLGACHLFPISRAPAAVAAGSTADAFRAISRPYTRWIPPWAPGRLQAVDRENRNGRRENLNARGPALIEHRDATFIPRWRAVVFQRLLQTYPA